MRVRFASPAPELESRVSLYWSWSSMGANNLPRTFPSIHTEIIIHYERPLRAEIGDGRSMTTPVMHIVGPGVPYTDLYAKGPVEFFAMRLMPGVLSTLCGVSARELKGALTALDDLCVDLRDALRPVLDARDFRSRAHCANLALIHMLRRRPPPRLDAMTLFPRPAPENWSVRNMARVAGWSERHLGRVFRDEIGVAPVEFLRMFRFQNTLFRIAAQPDIDLTKLALDGGYYDQAHLTSEVKRFSGRTPAVLKRNTVPHDLFFPDSNGNPFPDAQDDQSLR